MILAIALGAAGLLVMVATIAIVIADGYRRLPSRR